MLANDPQALDRFQREAQAASALNHPNICTIYDIGEHDGRSLHRHGVSRRRDAEAPHRRPAAGTRNVCSSSASKSPTRSMPPTRKGIVHRDIKPANIFVTEARSRQDSRFRSGQSHCHVGGRGYRGIDCDHSRHRRASDQPRQRRWARSPTCRPSRRRARNSTPAPICSPSAPCSTRWPPARLPFRGDTSRRIFDAILNRNPVGAGASESRPARRSWKTSSTRRWRKIAICATRVRPTFAPT